MYIVLKIDRNINKIVLLNYRTHEINFKFENLIQKINRRYISEQGNYATKFDYDLSTTHYKIK